MKRLAYFLAAIAAAISWVSCTPAAAEPVHRLAVGLAGDSIRVTVFYGTNSNADSTRITVTSSTGPSLTRTVIGSAKGALMFTFAAPAEGATATGQATSIAYRLGVASAASPAKSWSYTRPITAPNPTPIDSITVQQIAAAIAASQLLDTALVVLPAGETCPAQIRDYHYALLIAPDGPQSATCAAGFAARDHAGQIGYDNAASLAALDPGVWTPRVDSLWRAGSGRVANLANQPRDYAVTDRGAWPLPPLRDTDFVSQPSGSSPPIVTVAFYRAAHPGWTWPA